MDWQSLWFTHWMWWILAALLLIMEIMAPGVFFIWISFAAAAVGLALIVLPDLSPEVQGLLFAVLAIVFTVLGRRYFRRQQDEDAPADNLNVGGRRLIGRMVVVSRAIEGGEGRVRVGDTEWSATGPDAPAGTRLKVVGADGNVLRVAPPEESTAAGDA